MQFITKKTCYILSTAAGLEQSHRGYQDNMSWFEVARPPGKSPS